MLIVLIHFSELLKWTRLFIYALLAGDPFIKRD